MTATAKPVAMPRPIKVVLIYPSSHDSVQTFYAFNKKQMIGYKPPQSVLILATYLRSKGFSDVHCLDAQVEQLTPEQTVDRLVTMAPDVIGITAWTDFWYPVWKTLTLARERLPSSVLVVGGPHASVYPEETLRASPADFVVAGDGEDVLLNLVDALQRGLPVPEEAGLWRKIDGQPVAPAKPFAVVSDITVIPPPDRTLLDYKRYSSVLTPSDYETTMVTSRGCPYRCVFCKMDVQKVYARTAEQVVEEFRQIAALGITDVQVYDDTFTWGAARAMDICRGIIDSGIKVNWAIRDRVNRVTPELYGLLKQAGCNRVHFGVETGSPKILKASGKFITLDQVHKGMEIARSVDMTVMCYFMFGFIDETLEDAKMTVDLAKQLNPDYASFGVLIPYPGTEIYKTGLSKGLIPTDYWREFALNPRPDFRIPYVVEDILDRQTLLDLKSKATRSFYAQPHRIFRELRKLHSFSDFINKARLGAAIFADGLSPKSVYRY
jgi:anaerobic magnesium-protoporphyrin IX monomethyl ester cyclase